MCTEGNTAGLREGTIRDHPSLRSAAQARGVLSGAMGGCACAFPGCGAPAQRFPGLALTTVDLRGLVFGKIRYLPQTQT